MPAPQYALYNFNAVGGAPVNAVETVVATTRTVSSSYPGCTFAVEFVIEITPGTNTTAVTFRIRQTGLTGTAILTSPAIPATAAVVSPPFTFSATDAPAGEVAGMVYVLTCVQTAGSANGATANAFTKVTVAE